jgi:hypothetical protein
MLPSKSATKLPIADGKLFVELGRCAGEAHRRGERVVLAVGQLLRHEVDPHLVFPEMRHYQQHRPLPQEWNELLKHESLR